jgi:hypothetical protein
MRFKDKVVLVMGGNSGIGRAASIDFGKEGAHVFLTGRSRKTIDETVALKSLARAASSPTLVTSRAAVTCSTRSGEAHGGFDVLFRQRRHRRLRPRSRRHARAMGRGSQRQSARLLLRHPEGAPADAGRRFDRHYRLDRFDRRRARQHHVCRREGRSARRRPHPRGRVAATPDPRQHGEPRPHRYTPSSRAPTASPPTRCRA